MSASAIEANRSPDVQPLPIDDALLHDREYRQIQGSFSVHRSPNSVESETYGPGYTFLTVFEQSGDWSRVGENQWVKSELLSDAVAPSRFAGALLPVDGMLPYPVAWTLWHLRGSKTPGGPEAADNPFLYRYTRVYIYATVEVNGYYWYQIGANQWVHQFKVAKLLPVQKPAEIDT
ncbi:MAG: hypothetical protein OXG68_13965, partial [Chloroflexi bacterium]|nr:hypothetical protein [Chloroflexota bacterium]